MNRKHTASDTVEKYITALLQQSHVTTLPPLREIAIHCNVCPATVYKVIISLKNKHNFVSHWGHEIRVGQGESKTVRSQNVKNKSKWQTIRDLLMSDFIDSQHKSEMFLPAKKVLQSRYNISYSTLSKALKPLIASGKIEIFGGRLRMCTQKSKKRWKPKILVICAGVQSGIPKVVSEREREFFQYLTIEASNKYVELEFVIYEDWGVEPLFHPLNYHECSNLPYDDAVLGYIVSSWHIKSLENCIYRLLPSGKPVAIWLEHPTDIQTLTTRKQVAYFNIGYSKNAGRDIAEHFLRLGHREIAFLSPFHDSLWSRARLSGIIETFEKQDSSYKVHPMVITSAKSEWDYSEKIMKIPGCNNQQLGGMAEKLPVFFKNRITNFYDEYFRLYRDSLIIDTIKSHLDYIIMNSSITAVIAANDHSALLALDYFKNQGIPVPSRISLAGFDNSFNALVNGLTSYSFDTYSMVRAMIAHITDDSNKRKHPNMYLFDGTVIERATTGFVLKS